MIIDITPLLVFIASLRWDAKIAWDVAQETAGIFLTLDHDVGAGESWIRLLNGSEVVALVHTVRSVMVVTPSLTLGSRPSPVAVVFSTDLSTKNLTATQEALELAFSGSSRSQALREPFSMEDLWFATV